MSDLSYFDRIQFKPQWRDGLLFKYLTNMRIVVLAIGLIVAIGISSYFALPRRLNPDIEIPIVSVSAVLPGAGPESVEQLLTIPLEDAVQGVRGISKVTSNSGENVSSIVIEFESGTDGERARQDVQSAISSVTDLPDDAQTPRVALFDFENQPVWEFAIVAPEGEEASLMKFGDELEHSLDGVTSVDRVEITGQEKREVRVAVDVAKVAELGLQPQALSGAVSDALSAYPAGSTSVDGLLFPVAIDPAVDAVAQLRDIPIRVDDQVLLLGQIATVQEQAAPNNAFAYHATSEDGVRRAVTFAVYRNNSFNIDRTVADARAEVAEVLARYQNGFEVIDITDTAGDIDTQFNDLLSNFSQTMILVALVLFAFLGIRQSLVAAFAIPLVFLITFGVMQFTGISLNFLSLFSLLLSLGLLVDAAIVVITAVTAYYRSGKFTAAEAGRLVFADFFMAILTTTLTTVWAFLPLLLATGIIGEFIKSIPIVVSTTLLASMVVGLFVNLPLMMYLLNFTVPRRVRILLWSIVILALIITAFFVFSWNPLVIPIVTVLILLGMIARFFIQHSIIRLKHSDWMSHQATTLRTIVGEGVLGIAPVASAYGRVLGRILNTRKGRWLTVIFVVIFSIFSYVLVPFGFVKNEFFPGEPYDIVYMNVRLPVGTKTEQSNELARQLAQELRNRADMKSVVVESGRSLSIDGSGGNSGPHTLLATFTLNGNYSPRFAESLRQDYDGYARGEVQIVEISGGPPAGADLQIKLFGDNLQELGRQATLVEDYLKSQPSVIDTDQTVEASVARVVFVPNDLLLSQHGLTRRDIAFWMRTLLSGFTLDDIRLATQERDIVLRLDNGVVDLSRVQSLMIPTPSGQVPLSTLGTMRLDYNPTQISREDGKRTISVSASLAEGAIVTDENAKLETFADGLQLPSGYFWQTGGVNEENNRSVQSILQAMALSAFLIFATMVLQFGSFRKAILVLLVIPPAISGVFVLFALTGTPLSFPALIGVLALFGIVVNNSIIVIEKIGQNLAVDMTLHEALVDAGQSRLEPIFFSSLTTIIGLVPITLSNPLWQGLGGAIIAGLVFSGVIMLFFIPVVYYMWFEEKSTSAAS